MFYRPCRFVARMLFHAKSLDNHHYSSVIKIEFPCNIHEFEKPLPIQPICFSKFGIVRSNFQRTDLVIYVRLCKRRYLELPAFSNVDQHC